MKALQLVLLVGVMAAPHVSWAAEVADTQTLAPGVEASPKDLTPLVPLPAVKVNPVIKKDRVAKPGVKPDRANIGSSNTALPAVQRGITSKSVKRPDASGAATTGVITKIDPGRALGEGAGNIMDAAQAREMQEMKDMMDAVRNQAVEEADLGLGGDGGMTGLDGRPIDTSKAPGGDAGGSFEDPNPYGPDTPGNQGGKTGGNPLAPSTNPADWMSGGASQGPVAVLGMREFNASGYPAGYQMFAGENNGTSSQRLYQNGALVWATFSNPRTGTHSVVRGPGYDSDNPYHQTSNIKRVTTAPRSEPVPAGTDEKPAGGKSGSDGDGGGAEVPDRPKTGIDKTQDPDNADTDGKWARFMYALGFRPRPDNSNKNPNRVNPGPEGAMSDPKAPRLQIPEDQLVINPNPDAAGSQAGGMSDARIQAEARDAARGPGPGPDPGSPDGLLLGPMDNLEMPAE